MTKAGGSWSDDEKAIIAAHFPIYGRDWDGWESLLPLRSTNAIASKAHRMGIGSKAHRTGMRKPKEPQRTAAKNDRAARMIGKLMESGMPPSEIDGRMKWTPGRTVQIMRDTWRVEGD